MKCFTHKFLILTLIFLASCESEGVSERKDLGFADSMLKCEYSGHSYVVWVGYQKGAMVHNPDCQCKTKE